MLAATTITIVVSAIVIIVHFETMTWLTKIVHRFHLPTRISLLLDVFILFAAHSLEVWIFAGGLYVANEIAGLGSLSGAFDGSARDYLYISLVNYTTLGYGEIVTTGHLHTICGFEALIGLLMRPPIPYSASPTGGKRTWNKVLSLAAGLEQTFEKRRVKPARRVAFAPEGEEGFYLRSEGLLHLSRHHSAAPGTARRT